jgi:hypothetical protein
MCRAEVISRFTGTGALRHCFVASDHSYARAARGATSGVVGGFVFGCGSEARTFWSRRNLCPTSTEVGGRGCCKELVVGASEARYRGHVALTRGGARSAVRGRQAPNSLSLKALSPSRTALPASSPRPRTSRTTAALPMPRPSCVLTSLVPP